MVDIIRRKKNNFFSLFFMMMLEKCQKIKGKQQDDYVLL